MSLFDTLGIAGSGLTAERLRMDVAASNIANADTAGTAATGPYQPEAAVFVPYQVGADPAAHGVMAAAIVSPTPATQQAYDPSNPAANAQGYVATPNIDVAAQMADLLGASRSFQLDATVAQAAKQSALDALSIGQG